MRLGEKVKQKPQTWLRWDASSGRTREHLSFSSGLIQCECDSILQEDSSTALIDQDWERWFLVCLFICFSFLAPGLQGNTSPTQAQEQRHHSVRHTQKGKQFLQKYLGKVIRQMDYYGLQQSKQQTLGRGESDLQSYHILMLKCPVFNNDQKKSHSVQKQESTAHLKE